MKRPVLRILAGGGIGDVVLHTPAIRAWKQSNPRGKLIVYYLPKFHRELLQGNPHIDSLRSLSPLHLALLASSPVVQRWFQEKVLSAPYGGLAPSLFRTHAAALIGEMLGVQVDDIAPEIFLSQSEEEAGRARVEALDTPVAIHTIARCSENKQWPLENWEALVRECPKYTFVQVGDPKEPHVAGAHDLRGLKLRDSLAVLKHCSAFVGIESGPALAVAALGVPAIVLFGPSSPVVSGYPTAINMHANLSCSPCIDTLYSGHCPYDRACMRKITVQQVRTALHGILSAAKGLSVPAIVRANS
jgi:ADP-heptose:LPS heptosyltransferase